MGLTMVVLRRSRGSAIGGLLTQTNIAVVPPTFAGSGWRAQAAVRAPRGEMVGVLTILATILIVLVVMGGFGYGGDRYHIRGIGSASLGHQRSDMARPRTSVR